MAITEYKTGSVSISTTEYSLVGASGALSTDTTDGVFQVFIDFAAMTVTEEYRIKVYEKVTSGGTQRVIYDATLIGPQSGPLVIPSLILMHGWDVTVDKIAGTDRTIAWSIRQVA